MPNNTFSPLLWYRMCPILTALDSWKLEVLETSVMCGYGYAVRPLSIWRWFFFYFCKSHRVLKYSIKILLNCRPSGLIQRIYQKECIVVVEIKNCLSALIWRCVYIIWVVWTCFGCLAEFPKNYFTKMRGKMCQDLRSALKRGQSLHLYGRWGCHWSNRQQLS